jgi:hypothetical protein
MTDLHIRVLRGIALSARRHLAADRRRKGEDPAAAAGRARDLERRSKHADAQLAAAEARRREGSAH